MFKAKGPTGPLRIAMVGTRGVPAKYGGFETAVEEIGRRLADRGHEVVVYCRGGGGLPMYRGMRRVELPALRSRSLETLSHTGLSAAHQIFHPADAAIVFNAANAPWLPLLRAARIPVATHMDGLEWKRAKWGPVGKRYYRVCESLAVRWSDALIADARGIADYYRQEFNAETRLLTYGAPILPSGRFERLAELGLEPNGYHLLVARFEPENHVEMIIQGYLRSGSQLPLVAVGSCPYNNGYIERVEAAAQGKVKFLGGVWDQELLDQLYGNARIYWHGHSVGGTNPSLLRAMGAGAAVNAFDVGFNREVLHGTGQYFADPAGVASLMALADADPEAALERGRQSRDAAGAYDWDLVTDGYEKLSRDLVTRTARKTGGRRLYPALDLTAAGNTARASGAMVLNQSIPEEAVAVPSSDRSPRKTRPALGVPVRQALRVGLFRTHR